MSRIPLLPSPDNLPVKSYRTASELREWLTEHHSSSPGIWVQLAKVGAPKATVSFSELLDEGLCFGWSESKRRAGDSNYYLQRFTPRGKVGTGSRRNIKRAQVLIASGRMTSSGLVALGLNQ